MIVCSCTVLTKARILAAATELAAEDPFRPITPGRIFRHVGYRPSCGTCFSTVRSIIADAGLAFTCPEPLASVAEAAEEAAALEVVEVLTIVTAEV